MVNLFYLDKDPKKCAKYYCDKHVSKIAIEIAQILSQVHHNIGTKTPPYKPCKVVGKTLKPYLWAMESKDNYLYCCNLAKELLKEYKFRYNKKEHKCDKPINWLLNNIPDKIIKKKLTKFKLTENVAIYEKYFNNPVVASRYIYVDFKCKNDKWTKRGKPKWFDTYEMKSKKGKKKLIKQIFTNVKIKLPEFSKKNKLKTRRFHSFLRICYDHLFQDKWNNKIKTLPKMFNSKKPLIYQLGLAHLKHVLETSNKLFKLKIFHKLNNQSLKFRKKLK